MTMKTRNDPTTIVAIAPSSLSRKCLSCDGMQLGLLRKLRRRFRRRRFVRSAQQELIAANWEPKAE